MKKLYTLCLFIAAVSANVSAQTPVSPVQSLEGKTIHRSGFGLFFEQYDQNGNSNMYYQFLGKYTGNSWPSAIDTSASYLETDWSYTPAFTRDLDMEAGDFNGDGYDDFVSVMVDTNRLPSVFYNRIDTSAIRPGYRLNWQINRTVALSANEGQTSRVQLAAGNFDGNGKDDFIVGYVDEITKELRLQWYWINLTPVPALRSSVTVPKDSTLSTPVTLGYDLNSFNICTGDFDGNGDDELAVCYLAPGQVNQLYITYFYVAVFDMENGQFIFKGNKLVVNNSDANNCTIASGYFADSTKADLAYGIGRDNSGLGTTWAGIMKIDILQTPSAVISNVTAASNTIFDPNNYTGRPNIACGDLNGDGWDEVVMAAGSEGRVLQINHPNYTITPKAYLYLNYGIYSTGSAMKIADVDRDGKKEIVLAELDRTNSDEEFIISMLNVNAALTTYSIKAEENYFWYDNGYTGGFPPTSVQYPPRRYALITGDFDGKVFTVGQGIHYVKRDVVQPLVILNAPPVHFDVLGGDTFDITQCYNGNNCDFASTYFTALSTEIDVTTEVSRDWGVDAKLSAGGNFGVVDVGGYMSASYGEKFSNSSGNTTTVNIQTEISAVEDDYIYATVADYDIWEYAVSRKGKPMGNMVVLSPTVTNNTWFPSKSWNAFSYIPNHEVGNIMSYKNYPNLNNPDAALKVKADYQGNSITLGSNNNFHWMLEWSDVQSNTAVQQRDIGVELGANVGAYGVSLETNAHYNQSQLQTYTSRVTNTLSIKTDITSPLDMSIGEVRYTITPYTYWAQNGALVLDYAVAPELQNGGGTPTWWYDNYNIQDPAFILPWRYDPEKGFTLQDDRKRRQTKSIMVYPQEAETGDTVKIRAVVHNFGLQPSSGPIALKFYIGDPVYQRVITDINGNSSFTIPVIDERDRQVVEIDWKVPAGIYRFPKIYASIDPDNTITELHRNNNIGWNLFGVTDGSLVDPDSVTSVNDIEQAVSLVNCFPNPFGSDITLNYEMKDAGAAKITVCDVTGKVVGTVLNQQQTSGKHSLSYDASALSPGVYFFNFALPGYTETKRLAKFY